MFVIWTFIFVFCVGWLARSWWFCCDEVAGHYASPAIPLSVHRQLLYITEPFTPAEEMGLQCNWSNSIKPPAEMLPAWCRQEEDQRTVWLPKRCHFWADCCSVEWQQHRQRWKRCHSKMSHIIDTQSDTDYISLSVTESNIRYSRLVFDVNEVKLICLSIQQHLLTVSVSYTHVICRVQHFRAGSAKWMGCMRQSNICL